MDLQDVRRTEAPVPASRIDRSRNLPMLLGRFAVHRLLAPEVDNGLWLAWDLQQRQRVMVRAIPHGGNSDTTVFASSASKLDGVVSLSANRIAPLLEIGADASQLYFIFQHTDEPTWYDVVTRDGPMSWAQLRPLARQVFESLIMAHEADVVHGRLAPWRCVLSIRPQAAPSIRLLELAGTMATRTIVRAARRQFDQLLPADVSCLAPELLRGSPPDPRSDVYGAGLLLYFALTGALPFANGDTDVQRVVARVISEPPASIRHLAPGAVFPDSVEQAVLWALAKDPRHRLASIAEFEQALGLDEDDQVEESQAAARDETSLEIHSTVEPEANTVPALSMPHSPAMPAAVDPPLAPQEVAPQEVAPQEVAPQEVAPQEVAPHGYAAHDPAPHQPARPQKAAPQVSTAAPSPAPSERRRPEFPGRSLAPEALHLPLSAPRNAHTLFMGSNEIVGQLVDAPASMGQKTRRPRVTQMYETVEIPAASGAPLAGHAAPAQSPTERTHFGGPALPHAAPAMSWPTGEATIIEPDITRARRTRTVPIVAALLILSACIAIPIVLVLRGGGLGLDDDEVTKPTYRDATLGLLDRELSSPDAMTTGDETGRAGSKITIISKSRPRAPDAPAVVTGQPAEARSFGGPSSVAADAGTPDSARLPQSREEDGKEASSFPALEPPPVPRPRRTAPKSSDDEAYPEMIDLPVSEAAHLARAVQNCLAEGHEASSALIHFSPATGRPFRIELGYPPQRDPVVEDCALKLAGPSARRAPHGGGEIGRIEL